MEQFMASVSPTTGKGELTFWILGMVGIEVFRELRYYLGSGKVATEEATLLT